jgi:hypothetical protein
VSRSVSLRTLVNRNLSLKGVDLIQIFRTRRIKVKGRLKVSHFSYSTKTVP